MKRMKKLLTGFSMCMALAGGILISHRVQAAKFYHSRIKIYAF